MNPTSSNTSSADPEIQRHYAERQAAQQSQPVQGPRMVQGNPQQQDEDRDITHAAQRDAPPSQLRPDAGSDMRVVARSEAAAVTPLAAKPAVPVTREALNNAIRSNDLETIRSLLETGSIDLYFFDAIHELPLTVAARCGNSAAVRLLLQAGADFKIVDVLDRTALKFAAQQADPGVFMCMVEYGADIDAKDRLGKTLLMHAAGGGSKAIVQKLLSLNVDVNVVDKNGMTALMFAAKHGELDILALLLKHDAHVNLRGTQVKNATVTAIEQGNIPVLELLLNYGGEPYDLQGTSSPLVSDMLMHRVLLKPGFVPTAVTLKLLYGTSLFLLPEISADNSVRETLSQMFEGLKICSPITIVINEQLIDSGQLMQALTGAGGRLSQAQKSIAFAGLLNSLDGWIKSWPKDWTPYKKKDLSAQAEANLTALVKLQVEKLVVRGERTEMKLATRFETLLPQCVQFTQVKNGELVVDEAGLNTHLTNTLGLYGPLADQVAAAWFAAVNQQQQVILSSSLFQSGFDEQDSESEAGQVLLAAFGLALKQIDSIAGGTLLRSSTLQGQQAGLYADLMFRQLHMLTQYADQERAAS